MQMTGDQAKWRPFHETIVEAIRSGDGDGRLVLLDLIRKTKIPKNHDEIIAALKHQFMEGDFYAEDAAHAKFSVLEQKQASAQKPESRDEKKDINLDDLRQEACELLAVLTDPSHHNYRVFSAVAGVREIVINLCEHVLRS